MPPKHLEFVFGLPDQNQRALPIKDELVTAYQDQLTDDQKQLLGDSGVLRNEQPVFYLMERGKLAFFGHAMMFRIPYSYSPRDFVPDELRDPEQTDLAEALFGYVEENAKERPVAGAGRVYVSDAKLAPKQGNIWLDERDPTLTPKILSSPKPTTFQHYLVQTDDRKRHLHHYGSTPKRETVIRGHKLYWHKGDVERSDIEESDSGTWDDSQHTKIQPVRSGVQFDFRIHFENLSPVELGALLWLLETAADDDYRLKLGMGKPLGLGAIKAKGTLRLTNRPHRYTHLFKGNGWATGELADSDANETWQNAVQAFEDWILQDHVLNPDGAKALADVPRIQMLRFLLSWPGPSPPEEKTRYLEIEHPQHGNEYRERRVLPTPADVLGQQEIVRSPEPEIPTRPPSQTVSHPSTVDEVKPGDLLEGRVIGVDPNRVGLDLGLDARGSMGLQRLDQLVRTHPYFKEMYSEPIQTAREIYEAGTLEEDLYHTRMRVRVLGVQHIHGRVIIRLDLVEWL
jgi:hypothetical protein